MALESRVVAGTEIIFEVTADMVDGADSATALGHGIPTQGDSADEICNNFTEAVDCYIDESMPRPKMIRVHLVREDVLTG